MFVKKAYSHSMNTHNKQPRISPILAVMVGIFAASTASIFIRFAQDFANSLVIAAYRLSIATLVLSPIALLKYRNELRKVSRGDIKLGLLSGVFLALHFAAWISSLEYTTVASSVVFVSTAPLWVVLFSIIAVREPVSRQVFVGLVFATLGSLVVGVSDSCNISDLGLTCPPLTEFIQGEAFLGDILALIGAVMAAGYLIIGRNLRAKTALIPYIFIVYGIAALTLVGLAVASGQKLTGYPGEFYLWVGLLALIPQLLGHTTYNWALRYLSAAVVSITLLSEPIGSTVLAYFFLQEAPSILKLFGAILILAGIFIASKEQSKS